MERFKFRFFRGLKDLVWHLDYLFWLMFSLYKFKHLPIDISSVIVIEDIGLGDLLVSTPVFRALKKKYETVDVLVKPGMEEVLGGNPNVDRIVTKLDRKYDLGVLLHARTNGNYRISKLMKKYCRFRIGCTRVGLREGKGFFLNRKTRPTFRIKRKIRDNLDVIRTIGLECDDYIEAYSCYKPFLQNYVVFHTHGAYKTHNWYKEKWVELAKKIDKPIVFTGTDKEYVKDIVKALNKDVFDVTGSSIKEYFGWIKYADYVITVDTSAMHVAAAFDKKVVSLFGPGDPRIWKPNSSESYVLQKGDCHSCHKTYCELGDHRCMRSIQSGDILRKL